MVECGSEAKKILSAVGVCQYLVIYDIEARRAELADLGTYSKCSWVCYSDFIEEHLRDVSCVVLGQLDKRLDLTVVLDLNVEKTLSKDFHELIIKIRKLKVNCLTLRLYSIDTNLELSVKRLDLERLLVENGFRKHPSYYYLNPYESLNSEKIDIYGVYEVMSDELFNEYSNDRLEKERVLHMDMFREVGRRGDAHCIRYEKALDFIKQGDAVLDIACGLGYGSYLLSRRSMAKSVLGIDLSEESIKYARKNYINENLDYTIGDAEKLTEVPSNSFDFITGFETIEHVPNPSEYLKELLRVLKPGGRLFICAPNDWSDETGEDPNPFHLHVYTWEKLKREVGSFFILEKGFVQVAGGAMKCHFSPRSYNEVCVQEKLDVEAEWIILLAMKSPLSDSALLEVDFKETRWNLPNKEHLFNVSAFNRDYKNPWLVRSLFMRGTRLENSEEAMALWSKVVASSDVSDHDFAASICAILYAKLENMNSSTEALNTLLEYEPLVMNYEKHSKGALSIRWQISCFFVLGLISFRWEQKERALLYFKKVIDLDFRIYSFLLGIKHLDAYYYLFLIHYAQGSIKEARDCLLGSIKLAGRLDDSDWLNIVGTFQQPMDFGFAEMSIFFDKASRAVYLLDVIKKESMSHMFFQDKTMGYFERILFYSHERLNSKDEVIRTLSGELQRLNLNFNSVSAELNKYQRLIEEGSDDFLLELLNTKSQNSLFRKLIKRKLEKYNLAFIVKIYAVAIKIKKRLRKK